MTREDRITELNRIGEAWGRNREKLSAEQRQVLSEKAFLLAYELFPGTSRFGEMLGDFYIRYWSDYTYEDGALYDYMNRKLDSLAAYSQHQDREDHYVKNPKPGNGPKRIWTSAASLEQPVGPEENEITLGDVITGSGAPDQAYLDATVLSLISLILELPTRLKGKANNPQRLRYFRMFFTDSTVNVVQSGHQRRVLIDHERELFRAMHLGFLDFFMFRLCRTAAQIASTPIKPYGMMVKNAPMTEPEHPFPNDVYLAYLQTQEGQSVKTASTVSEMRQAYYRFLLEANLC